MCFSPVGDAFRDRLRRFPSLITCTTIDWFTVWPNDALASVAQQALAELDVDQGLRNQLATQCVHFHLTARELTDRWGPGVDRQTGGRTSSTAYVGQEELGVSVPDSLLHCLHYAGTARRRNVTTT